MAARAAARELHLSVARNARGVMHGGKSRCVRELHLSMTCKTRGV